MNEFIKNETVGLFDNSKTININLYKEGLSDVSKIIKEMIKIKNETNRKINKRRKVYTIEDKLSLNQISSTLGFSITKHHIKDYSLVDEVITNIEEFEAAIKTDLFDYYFDKYINILIDKEIDINDESTIKINSDIIYIELIDSIEKDIFENKFSSIEIDKRKTYLNSITAYVFYECKFLIPIKEEEL
ncbi:MAG: hypothetical protein ACPKNR_13350 [Pleomorphochaeta sp.]